MRELIFGIRFEFTTIPTDSRLSYFCSRPRDGSLSCKLSTISQVEATASPGRAALAHVIVSASSYRISRRTLQEFLYPG